MNEERFRELLEEAARDYNRPPTVPREAMWQAIQRRRQGGRFARLRRRPRVWMPAAAAALLLLGLGLGRILPGTPSGPERPTVAQETDAALMRFAALRHLGQSETVLTTFRGSVRTGSHVESVGTRATELLGRTRLLLDASTLTDPELRSVLLELELALAQIARASREGSIEQQRWVSEALQRSGILLRLRAASASDHPPARV